MKIVIGLGGTGSKDLTENIYRRLADTGLHAVEFTQEGETMMKEPDDKRRQQPFSDEDRPPVSIWEEDEPDGDTEVISLEELARLMNRRREGSSEE